MSLRQKVSRLPFRSSLYLCFLLSVSLSGCPRPQEPNTKEDLTKYMEEARQWGAIETKINDAITAVRRDEFVHDELTIKTLKPIVAVTQEYVQQLENYHPQEKPLQNVHLEYIEAWRAHQFAFAAIINCVEKQDYIQLAKAKDDLLEAQRAVSATLANLARLLREAGLRSETALPNQPPLASPQGPSGFAGSPQGQ